MPTIRIPTMLRKFTGGTSDVTTAAETVDAALNDLEQQHPGIGAKIMADGVVKPFIRIFVGEDDIEALHGLRTPLSAKDEISIIPAIAGGQDRAHA